MRISGHIRIALVTCLFGLSAAASLASSWKTAESSRVSALGTAFGAYKVVNKGSLPQNWDDLSRFCHIDAMNQGLRRAGLPPLQDRYEFVAQDLPYIFDSDSAYEKGSRVLLIRTVPMAEEGSERQYRYLIYQRANGEIQSGILTEERVQQMLKQANMTITPKPGLPAVEYEGAGPSMDRNLRTNGVTMVKPRAGVDSVHNEQATHPTGATTSTSPSRPSTPVGTSEQSAPAEAGPHWLLIGVAVVGALAVIVLAFRALKK
jgi:hypothetical protein